MNLSCFICQANTDTVTPDGKHAICSFECNTMLSRKRNPGDKTLNKPICKKADVTEGELSTKGRGKVKVTPDRVRVRLEIIRKAKTVSEVNRQLIQSSEKLLNLLKKETGGKAEKIQTNDLEIEPVYKQYALQQDEREIISYEGTFTLSFESLITDAGALIDLTLKGDATSSVEGLTYVVSDEISKPAYNEALKQASEDAQRKADVVLESLGLRKKEVMRIDIEDTGYSSSARSFHSSRQEKSAKMASYQIMAPEDDIDAMVSIVVAYELK